MDMLRICYCEDEPSQAELLKSKVLSWAEKNEVRAAVDLYTSVEEFLFKTMSFSYDLLFLDIAMKGTNGMELAKKVREKDKDVTLVFVTSDPSFVFDGYEVGAYRYLMKPIGNQKLCEILEYVRTKQNADTSCIMMKVENANQRILLRDVMYIEVQGHYVNIHLSEGRITTIKTSFCDIVKQMNAERESLIQTHRSYAVNLYHIVKIGRTECHLVNGEVIPVSKSAYKPLNDAFIKYNLER